MASKMNIIIKPLKFVSIIENFFCVNRNLMLWNKSTQFVLIIHGILEMLLILINSTLHGLYQNHFELKTQKMFFFSSAIYSLMQVILGFYYSVKYKQFIQYLNANHLQCKQNVNYSKKIKKLLKLVISVTSLLMIIQITMFAYSRFAHNFDIPHTPYFINLLFHINLVGCDYRYNYEFFVMFCYLSVFSEQLVYITESVEEFEVNKRAVDQAQNFDKWCMLYTNIKDISKMFNTVFGVQMTIMLATMVLFYIIFLYNITSLSVLGEISTIGLYCYIFMTAMMTFELLMLSHAAQRAQGSAETLRRRLARLTLNSLENGVYYKPAKDLLRVMSTCPIKTRAFGSIYVDMSLLPTCVVFFTYYTVIALQFNNIL